MSGSENDKFASCIHQYLKPRLGGPDGSKNGFIGNIPLILDADFNMGQKAHQLCYPGAPISWIQLLAGMTFSIAWEDNIPHVVMRFCNDIFEHGFIYRAECPYSIRLHIQHEHLQIYASIIEILNEFMQNFMAKLVQVPGASKFAPVKDPDYNDCVCCMQLPDPIPDYLVIDLDAIMGAQRKRKFDAVEPSK